MLERNTPIPQGGSGFRVLGFRVQGFRVEGSGFACSRKTFWGSFLGFLDAPPSKGMLFGATGTSYSRGLGFRSYSGSLGVWGSLLKIASSFLQ